MGTVCIQYKHKRWPLLNDPDPSMAMAVNSPLVVFGQAEKPFEIEIVPNFSELVSAGKETNAESGHQPRHMLMKPIGGLLEPPPQALKFAASLLAIPRGRIEGRGHFPDLLHMLSDRRLLALDQFQTTVDATA